MTIITIQAAVGLRWPFTMSLMTVLCRLITPPPPMLPVAVDQVEQQAGQAELAGQGHDERRQPELGDEDALQRAVGGGDRERGEDGGPPRVAEGEHPQRDDGAAGGGEAGGEVDLAEQQHEDLGHAEGDDERRLGHQVDQVARRQEQRVLDLEDDHDDDQADDDRQRAALARAHAPADDPQVVAERVGEQVGRRVRRRR